METGNFLLPYPAHPQHLALGAHAVGASAEQILLDDFVLAPLYQDNKRNLISKRVTGWVDNPIGYHLTKFLELQ